MKRKVLLHICCVPCSTSAVKTLCCEYNISFYWYNPNIYDTQEYNNRKDAAIKYSKELNVFFYEETAFVYNYDDWKNKTLEKCSLCYTLRLAKTAAFVMQNQFDSFSTSLLSSPYQQHDLIKQQIANNFAGRYMLEFVYKDFRIDFYDAKNSLKQKGYYIQKYCGCHKSYREI